ACGSKKNESHLEIAFHLAPSAGLVRLSCLGASELAPTGGSRLNPRPRLANNPNDCQSRAYHFAGGVPRKYFRIRQLWEPFGTHISQERFRRGHAVHRHTDPRSLDHWRRDLSDLSSWAMSLAYGAAASPKLPKVSAALLLTLGLSDLSSWAISLAYGAAASPKL